MKKSGSSAASTSSSSLLNPPQLQARRSSAPNPGSDSKSCGGPGGGSGGAQSTPPGTTASALLLAGTPNPNVIKSGARSATTSPVSGVPPGAFPGDKGSSPRHRTSTDAWVCPNDRQLALRAKLHSGWSVKTANLNQWKQPDPMSTDEHDLILKVIEKAEALEKAEMQRVGKLVERLETMRQCRMGNGETECVLCGEVFRFYHRSQRRCAECDKMTCSKCGVESSSFHPTPGGKSHPEGSRSGSITSTLSSSASFISVSGLSSLTGAGSSAKESIWLCKICSEEKEMWKKSGAWFFKSMPKYVLPPGSPLVHGGRPLTRRFSHYTPLGGQHGEYFIGGGSASGRSTPVSQLDDGNSSEEEGQLAKRRIVKRTNRTPDPSDESGPSSLQSSRRFVNPPESEYDQNGSGHRRNGAHHQHPLHPHHMAHPRSRSTNSIPITELDQAVAILSSGVDLTPTIITTSAVASNGIPHIMASGSSSPTSSIGSSQIGANEHMSRPRPLYPRGPGARSCSPRYYRPPHGTPPRGHPPRGGPPPWAYTPRGPPQFRPPQHIVNRSPSPSPPYSPRGMTRRGGPPPPGHPRFRGHGPPRFRGPGPPPHRFPPGAHSAPHSPVLSHRQFDGNEMRSPGAMGGSIGDQLAMRRPSRLLDVTAIAIAPIESEPPSSSNSANGSTTLATSSSVPVGPRRNSVLTLPPTTPPSEANDLDEIEEDLPSVTSEFPSSGSKLTIKPKPAVDKENKFTSTLRRLSTVRKRNKSKRKEKMDRSFMEQEVSEVGEIGTSPGGNGVRPSSTTSRESEAEVVTSGYFSRQESHSRGSDETLSSPRSPEGSYGTIEFTIMHDEANHLLVVNIIKAKKLKGTDANGLADTYCKVTILPTATKGGNQQCTKTVSKSINPNYNGVLHFGGIGSEHIGTTTMTLTILDEDLAGDNLLAETTLSLKKLLMALPQQKKFQLPLEKPDLKNTHDGLIVSSNVGQIEISLGFYAKSGTLKVTIIQCLDLPVMEESGSANAFVQVVMHPVTKTSKHQTTVKWKSLSPDFHEQFVYLTSSHDLPKQSLYITVWNKEKGRADEYIGGVILGMHAKGGRLRHWVDTTKNPSQVQKRTHFLSATYID